MFSFQAIERHSPQPLLLEAYARHRRNPTRATKTKGLATLARQRLSGALGAGWNRRFLRKQFRRRENISPVPNWLTSPFALPSPEVQPMSPLLPIADVSPGSPHNFCENYTKDKEREAQMQKRGAKGQRRRRQPGGAAAADNNDDGDDEQHQQRQQQLVNTNDRARALWESVAQTEANATIALGVNGLGLPFIAPPTAEYSQRGSILERRARAWRLAGRPEMARDRLAGVVTADLWGGGGGWDEEDVEMDDEMGGEADEDNGGEVEEVMETGSSSQSPGRQVRQEREGLCFPKARSVRRLLGSGWLAS